MRLKVKLKNVKAEDDLTVKGLFFIIDGDVYIDDEGDITTNVHSDFFKKIIELPQNYKYRKYPFYYFPRGGLLSDENSDWVMLNCPEEFSPEQRVKILKLFGLNDKKVEIGVLDHYSWNYIRQMIQGHSKLATWNEVMISDELEFAQKFFTEQLKMFD